VAEAIDPLGLVKEETNMTLLAVVAETEMLHGFVEQAVTAS
jgi:hypothetical protein